MWQTMSLSEFLLQDPLPFSLSEAYFSGVFHGNRREGQIEASDHLSSPLTALSRLFVPQSDG